jgi:AcrR family transcriptional regulator
VITDRLDGIMRTPEQTRNRLLEAALDTIREYGYSGLTLDAVARNAGVSKGGLLHHFRSKEVLIEAILRHLFEEFEARVQIYYKQDTKEKGRLLRAYIRATFEDDPPPIELAAMLMSALSETPALVKIVQEDFGQWRERLLNDGVPRIRARIIWQAADAYWLDKLLGSEALTPSERQEMIDELISMTEEG